MHSEMYTHIEMGMFKNTKHKENEDDKSFPFIISETHIHVSD